MTEEKVRVMQSENELLLDLKAEEGAMRQGMQVVSRSQKRQEMEAFFPGTSRKECNC